MNTSTITLFSAIKTASILQKERIFLPYTKLTISFLKLFYKCGLIQNFYIIKKASFLVASKVLVYIRYYFNLPIFNTFKIISKPSIYFYLKFADLCLISDKRHTLFLSTSYGVLSNLECKKKRLGGIALFRC